MVPAQPIDAGSLFRLYSPFVAGFLARLGGMGQDLDDLVQEVFLVAHRRGGYVPGPARPTTWLAEIALRVASTRRRTMRRRPESTDDVRVLNAPALAADPAEAAETGQALNRVQRALDTLDLDRRAAFILFELEGESCDAIAAGLGIPLSTVYSRLHTARKAFTEAYDKLLAREARAANTTLSPRVRT